MLFISSRNKNLKYSLSDCIKLGLAKDGGLFIPEYFPKINLNDFNVKMKIPDFAAMVLNGFFENDILQNKLSEICDQAFSFPIPLNRINESTFILDLCKGPTLSFKDFGARFLAECLSKINNKNKVTIMVATSGDTGSAVASAFYKKESINVIILYPKGKVSKKQEQQLACWDSNILSFAVNGTFDDCQKLVKEAFQDEWWQNEMHISSANSINIGRLLPQIVYYAYSSYQFFSLYNKKPNYIIPTGNLGNATAAFWAREMGFPINEISLSTNDNKVICDYLSSGTYIPQKSILTLANAMDVGNPSNFERLSHLFPTYELFKKNIMAISVDNIKISQTIQEVYNKYNYIICPHTATSFYVKNKLNLDPSIVVSTADPCKFDDIIEPIILDKVPISEELKKLINKKLSFINIEPNLTELKNNINK